jgi:hydroxyethylthiazole kinase-like uncharacterized protein yjeF
MFFYLRHNVKIRKMEEFNPAELKKLYKPAADSHKGQNGKLMIIGGSHLFHAASLWSLQVASRILDMVFYSSVPENNEIVQKAKEEFRNGIIVPRDKIEHYIQEAECILIGPGLPRDEGREEGDEDTKKLTEDLLKKYKDKKWVIDGGSLQTINPNLIPHNAILTPHHKEFETLFNIKYQISNIKDQDEISKIVQGNAEKYHCTVLLKGPEDFISNGTETVRVVGGNAGMTKGGTGDVLAGLTAAIFCKKEAFLSACAASFINKKAGESLYKKVGIYFNASDLANEIPVVMSKYI